MMFSARLVLSRSLCNTAPDFDGRVVKAASPVEIRCTIGLVDSARHWSVRTWVRISHILICLITSGKIQALFND